MIYPFNYSIVQAKHAGFVDFFLDSSNILAFLFNVIGAANAVIHFLMSPYWIWAKVLMVATIFISMAKTVQMLRIIRSFSPLVTMMSKVFFEFQDFILFFSIMLAFFGLSLGSLQFGSLKEFSWLRA